MAKFTKKCVLSLYRETYTLVYLEHVDLIYSRAFDFYGLPDHPASAAGARYTYNITVYEGLGYFPVLQRYD